MLADHHHLYGNFENPLPTKGKTMQLNNLNNATESNSNATSNSLYREVLRLSDLDAETVADLSNMFGTWFEADHCDKDIN